MEQDQKIMLDQAEDILQDVLSWCFDGYQTDKQLAVERRVSAWLDTKAQLEDPELTDVQ